MAQDRIEGAIAQLDAQSRALLELSLVKGLSDAELGSLLGTGPQDILERRERVLEELDVGGPDDRESVQRALRGGANSRAPTIEEPGEAPSRSRPRVPLVAIVAGLVAAVLVALVLALGRDADDEQNPRGGPAGSTDPLSDPGRPGAGALRPPAGGGGVGRAEISGSGVDRRLRISVRGLPKPTGQYVVWLYGSVSDARPLLASRSGSFDRQVALPAAARRYRYVDVSVEPDDGNVNHSGASVLRTALGRIPRR